MVKTILNAVINSLVNVKNFDINAKNKFGNTPLHFATENNSTEMVKTILYGVNSLINAEDFDINAKNKDGNTVLHYAAASNNIELVNAILNAVNSLVNAEDFDINTKNKSHNTPLYIAVENNNLEMVKTILNAGGAHNVLSKANYSSFLLACHRGYIDICKLLWAKKVSITQLSLYTIAVLHAAIREQHIPVAEWLLQLPEINQIINMQDEFGNTPLHIAVKLKHSCLVTMFLSKGAKQNIPNKAGKTVQAIVHDSTYNDLRACFNA